MFLILTLYTWGHWGNLHYDSFREAVLPQAVLNGKVFFKDILCLYPPLAYYFNAILYKIFGIHLNVMFCAGIITSFFILSLIFYIFTKISNPKNALITVFIIMFISTFRIDLYNTGSWFFPYSYSLLYAFLFVIIAVIFYFLYIFKNKENYLYLSLFFTGLSFAFKADYIMFCILPFVLILKIKSFSAFFKVVFVFLLPILLEVIIFITLGGTFVDIKDWFVFLNNFASTDIIKNYNQKWLPNVFDINVLQQIYNSVCSFGVYFGSILLITYIFIKNFVNKNYKIIFLLFLILLLVFTQYSPREIAYKFIFDNLFIYCNFAFLPYLFHIIVFYLIVIKHHLNYKEQIFLILYAISFCIGYRNWISINISNAGNYIIVMYMTTFLYYLLEVLPTYINNEKNRNLLKKSFAIAFLIYSASFLLIYQNNMNMMNNKIEAKRGSIYIPDNAEESVYEALNFAEQNKDKSFTFLEEGCFINFFTEIPINCKYYSLNSHIIETIGENNIINEFDNTDYIYILILPEQYRSQGIFGIDYGKDIYKNILKNYKIIKTVNRNDKEKYSLVIFEKTK